MPPSPYVRRYQDRKIVYDLDFPAHSLILRQRIYKSADGTIETPITSLFEAREVPSDTPAPRGRNFDPRHSVACFSNPQNQSGVSELKAIIPYRPTDGNHKAHQQEILSYQNALSARYSGESHRVSIVPYL